MLIFDFIIIYEIFRLLMHFLPTLKDIGIGLVPILTGSGYLYIADLIIASSLLYVFYMVSHLVLTFTNILGQFHKTQIGLERTKYRLQIIFCYLILTLPVYLAILSIIQLSSPPKLLDYVVIFPVILSFLISFRILANPTILTYRLFYRKNPFEPLLITNNDKKTIRYINDQVTSFFFAFIVGGIFIIVIGLLFEDSKTRLLSNLNGLISSQQNFLIFILSYTISLFLLGLFSEWFLEYTQVISVDEEDEGVLQTFEI